MYAREDRQEGLNPVVASHYHLRSYQERIFMQGTIDYSGYCAVPAALAFVKSIGGFEAVRKYNFGLVIWAAYVSPSLPSTTFPRHLHPLSSTTTHVALQE